MNNGYAGQPSPGSLREPRRSASRPNPASGRGEARSTTSKLMIAVFGATASVFTVLGAIVGYLIGHLH